jgi:hypothetical protein
MSLLSWLFPKPKPKAKPAARPRPAAPRALAPNGRSPLLAPQPQPAPEQAGHKNERMERRELLYTIVRDTMVHAGVLSAGYKFKVLSLDQRGAQFLVMVDLAPEYGGDTTHLSGIETQIVRAARTRFDILVPAVYWRVNHTQWAVPARAPGAPAAARDAGPTSRPAPLISRPAPLESRPATLITSPAPLVSRPAPLVSRPAPLVSRPAPLTPPVAAAPARAAAPRQGFEPVEADEVAAFKQALANAAAGHPHAPPPLGVVTRSGPLLPPSGANSVATGFEDTLKRPVNERRTDLSSTQYGNLD